MHYSSDVPHFSQKAKLRDYIKERHPNLKTIFVEPGYYMQNWKGPFAGPRSKDGTFVFGAPIDAKTKLHLLDIEDTGPIIREILNNPDNFVHKEICMCGDEIAFGDLAKIFTKVTGVPSVSKTLSEEEF